MNQPVEISAATANVLAVKSVLRVDGLRKSYRTRTVVSNVSFSVESGEVVGLLNTDQAANDDLGDKQLEVLIGGVPII